MPERDYVKLARGRNIPIMKNGNVITAFKINGKSINVTEACAFDTIIQLIANSIATVKYYENTIKSLENNTINLVMSILQSGKVTQKHYNERTKILIELRFFVMH